MTDPTPDYKLYCKTCGVGFFEMAQLLRHKERCAVPALPRQRRRLLQRAHTKAEAKP